MPTTLSTDFESGSIGSAVPVDAGRTHWKLQLKDDNNDSSLPSAYRTWWFVRADAVPLDRPLTFEISRMGWGNYYVPVYSYDGKHWQHFGNSEVEMAPGCLREYAQLCRLVIRKQFAAGTVWIARTYPYTPSDLAAKLASLSGNRYVTVQTIGKTPRLGLPLQLVTLEDSAITTPRKTVWIHARTHAAETGGSFVLEGLIDAVVANDGLGKALRNKYRFRIVPMHNPDGVALGNYRTNGSSINMETEWHVDGPQQLLLSDTAPIESRLLNSYGMAPLAFDQKLPVVLALNLHSSNSPADAGAFFFPHFGPDPGYYSEPQRRLWYRQLDFMALTAKYYGGRIEAPPRDGGFKFLTTSYPETWWWRNAQDAVNALTLETTYGRAGYGYWVGPPEWRDLGLAVAKAIEEMDRTPTGWYLQPGVQNPFQMKSGGDVYGAGE